VQRFAGLGVTGGVTDPFFADLSGLSFPGSGVVDILGNLQALDPMGNPITTFGISSVTLTQGASTLTPELDPFSLPAAMTYSSTLNPLSQVTLDPSQFNLGFAFKSDPSFQYSYTLAVTGVPDGGFLLFNDVEGSQTPEPGFSFATALTLFALISWRNHLSTFGLLQQKD
jgi:hypothetical protein